MSDDVDDLRRQVTELRQALQSMRRLAFATRMDLMAYSTLASAMISTLPADARQAVRRRFIDLAAQMMANLLVTSKSPDDTPIHAAQEALDRMLELIDNLPSQEDSPGA